ncbi:flagellar protein FlgN [Burkholderiaceae bacterium DAT-1]|nr:flagellar protein FlgN [Burkholderiaceae bacterium DAT-1]
MSDIAIPTLPVHESLAAEIKAVRDFVALLEAERDALINNAIPELERLSAEKTLHAQVLEGLAKTRKQQFEINGVLISSAAGHPLENHGKLPEVVFQSIAQAWTSLLELARQANDSNTVNGQLIESRTQQNRHLIKILRASRSPLVYDASGQPQAFSGGRLNDKA